MMPACFLRRGKDVSVVAVYSDPIPCNNYGATESADYGDVLAGVEGYYLSSSAAGLSGFAAFPIRPLRLRYFGPVG